MTSGSATPWFAVAGVFLVNAVLSALTGVPVLAMGQAATGVLAALAGVAVLARSHRPARSARMTGEPRPGR